MDTLLSPFTYCSFLTIERLRRDRSVLMFEIVRLRQQKQNIKTQLAAMEERLQFTERKQQQMMAFLARALSNLAFILQLIQRHKQMKELDSCIGKKRRLTASGNLENFQSLRGEAMEEVTIESEMEVLFSAMDDDSCCYSRNQKADGLSSSGNPGPMDDVIWEELLNDPLIKRESDDEEQTEIDVEVEDLASRLPEWGDDVHVFVEKMGF